MADVQQTQPVQPATQPIQPVINVSSEKIHLMVRNRISLIFDEDVKSITSQNATGLFDILPEHANFISLITSPLVIRKLDGQKKEITFKNGIIKVKDNAVYCYIDLLSQ
jgi:F0F1-type ATP synthase epsilon subunit